MDKREPIYTVGGDVSWHTTMEDNMVVLQKVKIDLPYDPTIPLLNIYSEKNEKLSFENIHATQCSQQH